MPSVHRQVAKGDKLAERAVHVLTTCTNHRRQFSLGQPDADSHTAADGFAVPCGEVQKLACDPAGDV